MFHVLNVSSILKAFGVEIKTNSQVEKIIFGNSVASGVEISSGDQYLAATIVSAINMNTTFLKLLDPYYLDQIIVKNLQNIKYRNILLSMVSTVLRKRKFVFEKL